MDNEKILNDFLLQMKLFNEKRLSDLSLIIRSKGVVGINALVTSPDFRQQDDGTMIFEGRGIQIAVPPVLSADEIIRDASGRYPIFILSYENAEIEYTFLTVYQSQVDTDK